MSQGILVFVEERGGSLRKASLEALSEAGRRIGAVGGEVTAVLIGSAVKGLAGQLGKYGAAKVIVVENGALEKYSTEAFTQALSEAVKKTSPKYVFAAYTSMAKDFVPRVA
ncbi:MAG TPA: hypothetical protein PL012_15960, partial [Candidatus Obscuribacter sp.]|nr:hypothetical protein [Candidatus Obscuribacter sp.]